MKPSGTWHLAGVVVAAALSAAAAGDPPPLPAGLGDSSNEPAAPALPSGLGGTTGTPALPPGLGDDTTGAPSARQTGPELPFLLNGFLETRFGMRLLHDSHEREVSLGEARLQLELEKSWEGITANLTTDFVYDPVLDRHNPNLESGEGAVDLREVNFVLRPLDHVDVKVGRQILTWGTGDLVFINDLFPKDWNSFLLGRNEEYLKAPSDAVKVSGFSDWVNVNVVYVPAFDADRYIDGRRASFYNAALGRRSGRDAVVRVDRPNAWFSDDEVAYRFYRRFGAIEAAAYGYHGYWKSPAGLNATGQATFPPLHVYGASVRGPVGRGIGNAEFGWYDSVHDRGGANPFVRNSELRFLVGYEQEVAPNFTAAMQYYVEWMLGHTNYRDNLAPGVPATDVARHVVTWRLTWLTMAQNLKWSLFAFYSPSDRDAYVRPNVHYKIDDHWSCEFGGNFFFGAEQHTFYDQFERNTNLYAALRYSF